MNDKQVFEYLKTRPGMMFLAWLHCEHRYPTLAQTFHTTAGDVRELVNEAFTKLTFLFDPEELKSELAKVHMLTRIYEVEERCAAEVAPLDFE